MQENKNRLIVADKGWFESAPEWLVNSVKTERELMAFVDLMPNSKQEIGDAELTIYLFTLSLRQPMDHDTTRIYLYLTTKLMKQKGAKVPNDIGVTELTKYEQDIMNNMKRELWRKRGGRIHTPITDALHQVFKKDIRRKK